MSCCWLTASRQPRTLPTLPTQSQEMVEGSQKSSHSGTAICKLFLYPLNLQELHNERNLIFMSENKATFAEKVLSEDYSAKPLGKRTETLPLLLVKGKFISAFLMFNGLNFSLCFITTFVVTFFYKKLTFLFASSTLNFLFFLDPLFRCKRKIGLILNKRPASCYDRPDLLGSGGYGFVRLATSKQVS